MEYDINETNDLLKISIVGAMEIQSIKDFQEKMKYIEITIDKDIEIDMSKVDYIDSTGISLLIIMFQKQNQKGKTLKIGNASQRVKDLLQLTSLTDILC